MKRSGSILVECTNPHWATYEVVGGQLASIGKWGNNPTDAGVPLVPGLRYRITFEIVGVGDDKPRLESYWKNWAGPRDQQRARRYFKSKKEQKAFPQAREHMHKILSQAKKSRAQYQRDLRLWGQLKKAKKAPVCKQWPNCACIVQGTKADCQ